MTLAPIRGAPPGASVPGFPIDVVQSKPAQPAAAGTSNEEPESHPMRQPQTPIEIGGSGITLTFRVVPEIPAIARASMIVQVVADTMASGFIRMSAANARAFLADLRNGHSPIVATGDEDGTVQIECQIAEAGAVFLVCRLGERQVLHRLVVDRRFDLTNAANELLADLGA